MLSASQPHLTLLACSLVAPLLGLASTCPLSVNGTTIGASGSTSGSGSCTVDGGLIDVTYGYFSSETGGGPDTTMVFNATATYVGGTALAAPFVFTVDDIQFFDMTTFSTKEQYDSSAGFGGPVGSGSSLDADLVVGANTLPSLDFTSDGGQTSPIVSLTAPLSNPVEEQFSYQFTFGTSTSSGATITSTPEPGGVIPVAAILVLGLGVPAIRRSRLFSKNLG